MGCTDGLTFQDNSGATHKLPDIGTKSLRPNCYGAMRVYGYTSGQLAYAPAQAGHYLVIARFEQKVF